jgi:hypothetical protein
MAVLGGPLDSSRTLDPEHVVSSYNFKFFLQIEEWVGGLHLQAGLMSYEGHEVPLQLEDGK